MNPKTKKRLANELHAMADAVTAAYPEDSKERKIANFEWGCGAHWMMKRAYAEGIRAVSQMFRECGSKHPHKPECNDWANLIEEHFKKDLEG